MIHPLFIFVTAAGCVGMVMFGGVLGNAVWGYLSDVLTDKVNVMRYITKVIR